MREMGETRGVILLHNLCFIFLPFLLWPLWGLSLSLEMLWLSPGWVPGEDERAREKDSSGRLRKGRARDGFVAVSKGRPLWGDLGESFSHGVVNDLSIYPGAHGSVVVCLPVPLDHDDLTVRAPCCLGLFISQYRCGLTVRLEREGKGGRDPEIWKKPIQGWGWRRRLEGWKLLPFRARDKAKLLQMLEKAGTMQMTYKGPWFSSLSCLPQLSG